MRFRWMRLRRDQRGTALIEMAFTLPLLLLISIGIIEFGRAFQTWQVLTNAARSAARVAVLPRYTDAMVTSRVQLYIQAGVLAILARFFGGHKSKSMTVGGHHLGALLIKLKLRA